MALKLIKQNRFEEIPKLYTKKQTLEMLNVSSMTLWRLEKNNELKPVKIAGRIMYAEQEILRYLNNAANS